LGASAQGLRKNTVSIHKIVTSPEASPFPCFFDQFTDDFVHVEFQGDIGVFRLEIVFVLWFASVLGRKNAKR
jgi:hypothetical protein